MTTTFDLRLDTLRTAYTAGKTSPRQLILELRDRAAALNGEFNAFIHLLSAEELEPYLAALDGKSVKDLPLYGIPFAIIFSFANGLIGDCRMDSGKIR